RNADVALILLTPASIQKPWVIWEAGAVAGAAFATSFDNARVFPVTYGIKASDVPTPFARTQLVAGADEADMLKTINDLFSRFGEIFTREDGRRFGERQGLAVRAYLDRIRDILLKLPLVITEGAIQEWVDRLEELEKGKRFSETMVMESW